MILDTLPNLPRYAALHPLFPEAIRFLQRPDLAQIPDGRYDLTENLQIPKSLNPQIPKSPNLFAIIQSYDTEPLEGALLEGHEQNLDIQFILAGRETIGWAPREGQSVATPYDPPRDIAFFHGPCQPLQLRANDFMILWPSDLHLPMRHFANAPERVRKIVVKINEGVRRSTL